MSHNLTSQELLARLHALHPQRIDLSLDRMHRLLTALGHPQDQIPPALHIAGTNGKGSTLSFLRAILSPAPVHSYTSPHLVHFHERITLAGEFISEQHLQEVLEECERANADAPITFFEITTAAAFLAFSQKPADWVLLEVGLGGRLDATNVITPQLSIITPVDLDHQDFLGTTRAAIAAEKAGIIKDHIPVIAAPQSDDVASVLDAAAQRHQAPLLLGGRDWHITETSDGMMYRDAHGETAFSAPSLIGAHQIINAGTAITAARHLGIADDQINAGLQSAFWPARLQRLTTGPLVSHMRRQAPNCSLWLDGGHNPAAATALGNWIVRHQSETSYRAQPHLIVGLLTSKDAQGFFEALASCFDGRADPPILHCMAIPHQENATSAEALAHYAQQAGLTAQTIEDPATITLPQDLDQLIICGSLYLAGWVLSENQ